jgi:hypothetical protein
MTRTDRIVIAAFMLAVAVAVGTVVVAVMIAGRSNEDADAIDFHEPESKDERAAAVTAVAYLGSLQQGHAHVACRYAAERIATELRCSGRPGVPRRLRMERNGELEAFDVRVRGADAGVWVGGGEPGPVQDVGLRRVGRMWRVISHERFGFL